MSSQSAIQEQRKNNAIIEYSTDNNKNQIIGIDTETIYSLNVILMMVYYALLLIFVYFVFSDVRNSPQKIKKSIFVGLLFLYPIIIFPIQHNIYYLVKLLINNGYQNIYISKDW
jgi:hypothetical protein